MIQSNLVQQFKTQHVGENEASGEIHGAVGAGFFHAHVKVDASARHVVLTAEHCGILEANAVAARSERHAWILPNIIYKTDYTSDNFETSHVMDILI